MLAAALFPAPTRAEPLGRPAIAAEVTRALGDWKAGMRSDGWVGMERRIPECFRKVAESRSQSQAVYCIVLDHLTLVDVLNFPPAARPAMFATDTVFARLDKAVAQTTPKDDRSLFESRLLSTMDETIHQIAIKQEGAKH